MEAGNKSQVGMVISKRWLEVVEQHPFSENRYYMLVSLLRCSGMLQKLKLVAPRLASTKELLIFHDKSFLEELFHCREREEENEGLCEFELEDATLFEDMETYVKCVAGGTLSAIEHLALSESKLHADEQSTKFPIMIHWGGGRHHARSDQASGFCYVNDCVLGIFKLLDHESVSRVLYLDIDAHHGDAVSQTFLHSDEVFCVSFHHHAPGFFPNTGSLDDIGRGRGKYFNLNIPLCEGASDTTFNTLFAPIVDQILDRFSPDVIVLQCGVDGASHDPLGKLNLSSDAFHMAISHLVERNIPMLILGGGGYDPATTACIWTVCTAAALQQSQHLPKHVPDHEFSPAYAPRFEFKVPSKSYITDHNTPQHISQVLQFASTCISSIRISERNG